LLLLLLVIIIIKWTSVRLALSSTPNPYTFRWFPVSLYSFGLACIFWSLSLSSLFSRVDSLFVQSAVIPEMEYILGPPPWV
jgi:hypothetical protein